jgi:hypothetical protein
MQLKQHSCQNISIMISTCAIRTINAIYLHVPMELRCTPWENIRGLNRIRINWLHTATHPDRISRKLASSVTAQNTFRKNGSPNASANMLLNAVRTDSSAFTRIHNEKSCFELAGVSRINHSFIFPTTTYIPV